jgi:hypothetical protein
MIAANAQGRMGGLGECLAEDHASNGAHCALGSLELGETGSMDHIIALPRIPQDGVDMNTVAQAVQILSVRYSIRPASDKLDKRFGRFVRYIDLNLRLTGLAFQEINDRTQKADLDRWPGEIVSLIGEFIPLPERYAIQSVEYQPDDHYLTLSLMTGVNEDADDVCRIGFEPDDFEDDKLELTDDSDKEDKPDKVDIESAPVEAFGAATV